MSGSGRNVLNSLSEGELKVLLERYDLWSTLRNVYIYEYDQKHIIPSLLRSGILYQGFIDTHRGVDIVTHLPIPLADTPMNVVEDLFTLTLLRAWKDGDAQRQRKTLPEISPLVEDIYRWFLSNLIRPEEEFKHIPRRCASPSSLHRLYRIDYVEGILRVLRRGEKDFAKKAHEMMSRFINCGRVNVHIVRSDVIPSSYR